MEFPVTNWIWTPDWTAEDARQPRLVLFRRTIIYREGADARVQVSADTRYKLYVNGRLAEVGPDKGDRELWYADELDLRSWLRPGKNLICAEVLRYPPEREAGNHSLFRSETPGFYLTGPLCVTDGEWKCRVARSVRFLPEEQGFAPLIIHEAAAGDPALLGWTDPDYDDGDWARAEPYPAFRMHPAIAPSNLTPRRIPFLYRKSRRFTLFPGPQNDRAADWTALFSGTGALTVPPRSRVSAVADAGEEMTAYLHLALSGGAGSRVTLLEAECFVQTEDTDLPGRFVKGHRLDWAQGHLVGYTDVYTPSGCADAARPERYDPFWFRTFRFVEITVETGDAPLTLHRLDYTETGYPLEAAAHVRTSDPDLSAIWDLSLRTLRRCMHETYEDCPFYEQLQYIMDTRAQALFTYCVSADDRLARKAIDDFARSQRSDGLLNCCYPNMNPNVIPGFSLYYILMLHDHMLYFGDPALVRRYLPTADRILNFFGEHLTPEGLVDKVGGILLRERYWSFIDWSPEWDATVGMPPAGLRGPITMESLLYVLALQRAAELNDYIGRRDTGAEYRGRAAAVQAALRTHCMDSNGMLTDGPGCPDAGQQNQVFGILTGTQSVEEGRAALLRTLREPGHAQCQVAMGFYLFRALEETGLYEETNRCWEIWREMLRLGCTTAFENNVMPRSECHAWGALALYELPSALLGVRPAAPGYAAVRVRPHAEFLDFAEGTVPTPRGPIRVSWTKRDGAPDLRVKAPEGVRVLTE